MNPELVKSTVDIILSRSSTIVHAPTGSGKTTLIPMELLKRKKRTFVCLPTIYSVQSMRNYISILLPNHDIGSACDGDVEYTDDTLLIYCTSGYMENMLMSKMIKGEKDIDADVVIIDEFHMGSISNSVIHHIYKKNQFVDHLVIISATFPTFITPDLSIDVKSPYNVKIVYSEKPERSSRLFRRISEILKSEMIGMDKSKVLIFVKTIKMIDMLYNYLKGKKITTYRLHSKSDYDLEDINRYNIIIATNIAESSVTIPNLDVIIDTMLECRRLPNDRKWYEPDVIRLRSGFISKLSANQRLGRLGRTKDGKYYRLCTKDEYNNLRDNNDLDIDVLPLHDLVAKINKGHMEETFEDLIGKDRMESYKNILKAFGLKEESNLDLGLDYRLSMILSSNPSFEFIIMVCIIETSLPFIQDVNNEGDFVNCLRIILDIAEKYTFRLFKDELEDYCLNNNLEGITNVRKVIKNIVRIMEKLKIERKKFDFKKVADFMSEFNRYYNNNLFQRIGNVYKSLNSDIGVVYVCDLNFIICSRLIETANGYKFGFTVDPDSHFYF